ncbi:hypothetical protein [Parafilimonas sp.]
MLWEYAPQLQGNSLAGVTKGYIHPAATLAIGSSFIFQKANND